MISVLECLKNEAFAGGVRQITKQQAKLVSMSWPLYKNWKEDCAKIFITEAQAKEFKLYDRENRRHQSKPPFPFHERTDKPKEEILSKDFYQSREWRQVRYEALRKHGGRCLCCGRGSKQGVILHVDHIRPRSLYPELALSVNNLQILCEDCNLGKSNHDAVEWEHDVEESIGAVQSRLSKLKESYDKTKKVLSLMIKNQAQNNASK